jgi:Enoyl-(Acyl carrier protein) reductase
VNVLSPGQVETPDSQRLDKETREMFEFLIPRGMIGRPEEIATVVLFLASDDSELREWGGVVRRRRPLGHLNRRSSMSAKSPNNSSTNEGRLLVCVVAFPDIHDK